MKSDEILNLLEEHKMTFDKSKVFTFYDAGMVSIGSKGYFANSYQEMIGKITAECAADTLEEILDKSFVSSDGKMYDLFYLVDKLEERTHRPYKNTYEMIDDFNERYYSYSGYDGNSNPMYNPLIWLRDSEGTKYLISSFTKNYVYVSGSSEKYFSMDSLIKEFTYLDGTTCGKKI